jgi:hypothetical protein
MLQFNHPLNVESKIMYEEDPLDMDLIFGLDLEGSWPESHRNIHHNCCMKTLDDA